MNTTRKSIQQIEEELSSFSANEIIEVNLKQLLFIYKVIEEWRDYFHNPEHYPTVEELRQFVGDKSQGMYSILDHIYFKIFNEMIPRDLEDRF